MFFYILFILFVVICIGHYRLGNDDRLHGFADIRLKFGLFLIIGVSIFRFDVGYDYHAYYEMVYPILDEVSFDRIEPFSRLIVYLAYWVGCPQVLFVIFGCMTYAFLFSTFKSYSKDFSIALLTYLAFYYLSDLSIIRQALAVSITFWGIRYVERGAFFKYALTCIFASMFHSSALVAIIIYFIYHYSNWYITLIISIVFGVVLGGVISFIESYVPLYANRLEDLNAYGGGSINMYVYCGWIALIMILDRLYRNTSNEPLYGIVIFGAILPFVLGGHYGGRVAQYFLIYFCILIPNMCKMSVRVVRNVVSIALIMYFIALLAVNARTESPQFIPYKCVFFEDTTNPQFKLL